MEIIWHVGSYFLFLNFFTPPSEIAISRLLLGRGYATFPTYHFIPVVMVIDMKTTQLVYQHQTEFARMSVRLYSYASTCIQGNTCMFKIAYPT